MAKGKFYAGIVHRAALAKSGGRQFQPYSPGYTTEAAARREAESYVARLVAAGNAGTYVAAVKGPRVFYAVETRSPATRDRARRPAKKRAARKRAPRRDPAAKPAKSYRGWTIEPFEGTHIGYKLPNSRNIRPQIGRYTHRKIKGYQITAPPDETGYAATKHVDTLKEAHAYIDSYEGGPASRDRAKGRRRTTSRPRSSSSPPRPHSLQGLPRR